MQAALPLLRQESSVTQFACSALGAHLFYQFLAVARNIQEADASAFVARCLLEKNVPFDLDKARPLKSFYPKLIVTPQKTTVTSAQNIVAKQHLESNDPGSLVPLLRRSWEHPRLKIDNGNGLLSNMITRPLHYIMEKIAAATIPEYNP